jgi:hypothetical protein
MALETEDPMITRIRRRAALIAGLTVLATSMASPAAAAPPDRIEVDLFTIMLDLEHELVAFWNISRDDFCAWEASDFEGPAPVTTLIPAQEHTVRGEVLMATYGGTSSLELWMLDEGADLSGPCQDTDAQTGPWATGSARLKGHDNDVFVSLTRTNAFGEQLTGTVVDVDGNTWRFSAGIQLRVDRNDEFHFITERFALAGGH